MVNRVAYQASDHARSEGLVPWSEVVCSRGISVSLVALLPSCLRMKANEILVDEGACGEARSKTG